MVGKVVGPGEQTPEVLFAGCEFIHWHPRTGVTDLSEAVGTVCPGQSVHVELCLRGSVARSHRKSSLTYNNAEPWLDGMSWGCLCATIACKMPHKPLQTFRTDCHISSAMSMFNRRFLSKLSQSRVLRRFDGFSKVARALHENISGGNNSTGSHL